MERLYKLLADRPFAILAVNVKQPERDVARFTQRLGVTFPVLLDTWGQTQKLWKVKMFPTSFLVGPDGGIHYAGIGALEWDDHAVVEAVEALMPDPSTGPTGRPAPPAACRGTGVRPPGESRPGVPRASAVRHPS